MQMNTVRGVVVCPNYKINGRNLNLSCDVPAQDIRRYLLYWDKIAYAFPNGFGAPNLDSLPDLSFLSQEGLLTVHDTRVTTEDLGLTGVPSPPHLSAASTALFSIVEPTQDNPSGHLILGTPAHIWRDMNYFAPQLAAANLERTLGSVWSVAQTGPSFEFADGCRRSAPIIEAALIQALPVPYEDVALDELLRFRERRQPEILRFRLAIDALRDSTLNSDDLVRGLAKSRDELACAINDLHRALSAGSIRTFFSTLKLYMDLSDSNLATTTLAASIGAYGQGIPLEIGAAIGLGINTVLTFAHRLVNRPSPVSNERKDFMYLYEIMQQWPSTKKLSKNE